MTYFYHGTVANHLASITAYGLEAEPNRPNRSGLFVTTSAKRAMDWAEYAQDMWSEFGRIGRPKGRVVLRFDSRHVKGNVYEDEYGEEGDKIIDGPIPARHIDVLVRGRWIPLLEYVRNRRAGFG